MKKEILKINNLTKTFITKAGKIEVLKGINFSVYQGEIIAITGASGAGKSTFLHIIGALDSPTSGEIEYNLDKRYNLANLSRDAIAEFRNRNIGFVFQFHYLLSEFNVIENVILPEFIANEFKKEKKNKKKLEEKAFFLLKKLGLHERTLHKPGELSGGEQQRVAIARALFKEPPIILADEPTGNLDSKTAQELFELIKKINEEQGTTFIIVTHNEMLAKKCSRTLKMIDGVLIDPANS
jgi:lipoprotein-releasing system ATP-binding protein